MGDIAALTGVKPCLRLGTQLSSVQLSDLGSAKKVVIDKDTTTIVEGVGDLKEIKGRISQIKAEIETTTSDYDRKNYKKDLQNFLAELRRLTSALLLKQK